MPCLENISILPYEKCNMRGVAVSRLCRNMSPFLVLPGTLRFANHRNMAPKIRLWNRSILHVGDNITEYFRHHTNHEEIQNSSHFFYVRAFYTREEYNYSVTETTSKGGSRTGASGARPADWINLGGGGNVKFDCITCMYFNSIQLAKFTLSILFSTLTTKNLGYVERALK